MEEKEEKLDAVVSRLAYRKVVYHLLRYPTHKVYGTPVSTQVLSPAATRSTSTTPTRSSIHHSSTPLYQLPSTLSKATSLRVRR